MQLEAAVEHGGQFALHLFARRKAHREHVITLVGARLQAAADEALPARAAPQSRQVVAQAETQRAVGVAVEKDGAGHARLVERHAVRVLRAGTQAEQHEAAAAGVTGEQAHRVGDVRLDLLRLRARFIGGAAVAERGKVEAQGGIAAGVQPPGKFHVQPERPDPVHHAGIQHDHADRRGRRRRIGQPGHADQVLCAAEAEGALHAHAAARR